MMELTSTYQYLGRSAKIAPQSGNYGFYILLYGKSTPNTVTGYHTVSTKMVLACTINSEFYQYGTTYTGTINGASAFSVFADNQVLSHADVYRAHALVICRQDVFVVTVYVHTGVVEKVLYFLSAFLYPQRSA